jgi:hypothetical protein
VRLSAIVMSPTGGKSTADTSLHTMFIRSLISSTDSVAIRLRHQQGYADL